MLVTCIVWPVMGNSISFIPFCAAFDYLISNYALRFPWWSVLRSHCSPQCKNPLWYPLSSMYMLSSFSYPQWEPLIVLLQIYYFSTNESYHFSFVDYLRGFESFAATSFDVPDSHAHSFIWQRYGLKLHIPEGAVHTECRVDVKAGFTGQFNIPDELHLVSCVYWLSCPQKFQKPVTLEIEHCASHQDNLQCSNLRFVVGMCSQPELPYQFRVLEKGTFVPWSSYGSIEVPTFSFFAISILKNFWSSQNYRSTLHYIRKDVNKWEIDFVITSDLQASMKVSYRSCNASIILQGSHLVNHCGPMRQQSHLVNDCGLILFYRQLKSGIPVWMQFLDLILRFSLKMRWSL